MIICQAVQDIYGMYGKFEFGFNDITVKFFNFTF
jgi:hypothetical protein